MKKAFEHYLTRCTTSNRNPTVQECDATMLNSSSSSSLPKNKKDAHSCTSFFVPRTSGSSNRLAKDIFEIIDY